MIGPNSSNRRCYLCGTVLRALGKRDDLEATEFDCLCGHYSIGYDVGMLFEGTPNLAREPLTADEKKRLAWFVAAARENGRPTVKISGGNLAELLSVAPQRGDLLDAIDFALERIGRLARQISFGQVVPISNDEFALYRTVNVEELGSLLQSMTEVGYTKKEGGGVRLTPKGWERLRELRRVSAKPDQAFIAMSFRPELGPTYVNGIKPALVACGYNVLRVDEDPRDELTIDDRILAGIRESALVVADFSLHRPNVYLESGFAMGLGIPVIRTVRSADAGSMHFDQEHYPFIRWETPEELKARLETHIRARYPLRKTPL